MYDRGKVLSSPRSGEVIQLGVSPRGTGTEPERCAREYVESHLKQSSNRTWASFAKQTAVRLLDADARRQARLAVAGFELPALPREVGVWGIAMVKNEIDVIESVVRHMFTQDLDRVLIVDNGSTDGTLEKLRELAVSLPLTVGIDNEVGYYQAAKMTELARRARRAGAEWVVPFDADEFWFARNMSVGSFLRRSRFAMHRAAVFNAFPTRENEHVTGLAGGTLRFDTEIHGLPKVAVRTAPLLAIGPGNHWAIRHGAAGGGLYICHIPWRSRAQVESKVRQGKRAYEGTGLNSRFGEHWRWMDAESPESLQRIWLGLLEGQGHASLGWNPKGPFVELPLGTWRTWDPSGALS